MCSVPGSPSSFSTSTTSPTATLYCLPPVLTIAYADTEVSCITRQWVGACTIGPPRGGGPALAQRPTLVAGRTTGYVGCPGALPPGSPSRSLALVGRVHRRTRRARRGPARPAPGGARGRFGHADLGVGDRFHRLDGFRNRLFGRLRRRGPLDR